MRFIVLIFTFIFSSYVCAGAASCGDDLVKGTYSKNTVEIKLHNYETSKLFYLPAGNSYPYFQYAIAMKPNDVIYELSQLLSKNGSEIYFSLSKEIKADLPLRDNVDILNYGIENPLFMPLFNLVAMNLLATGKAGLLNLWEVDRAQHWIDEIIVATVKSGGNKYRSVCTAKGESVLKITDVIAD